MIRVYTEESHLPDVEQTNCTKGKKREPDTSQESQDISIKVSKPRLQFFKRVDSSGNVLNEESVDLKVLYKYTKL